MDDDKNLKFGLRENPALNPDFFLPKIIFHKMPKRYKIKQKAKNANLDKLETKNNAKQDACTNTNHSRNGQNSVPSIYIDLGGN